MNYNTVILKDYSKVFEELKAAAAITPGMLVEINSAGKVQAHATGDGFVLPMFAKEDALQGKTIDQDYAATDPVLCWIPGRGDIVNAILHDEENVAIGDLLSSYGNGTLKKYDAAASGAVIVAPECIVGVAITALNLSSSSAASIANTRIQVRIK